MKNLTALFIVFLLTINAFASLEIESIDGISSLGGIHSELIAMKTEVEKSSNDGVKTVAQFSGRLIAMLKDLQETQARHEGIASRMFRQCKEESSFRIKAINEGQMAYNSASNSFAKCQASLRASSDNLPTLRNAKKEYDNLLSRKTAERAKQKQLNEARAADWKSAIMFLNDFTIAVKNKIGKGISFADLSEHLLKHANKLGFIAEVVPLLAELAQSPAERATSVPTVKKNYVYLNQAKTISNLVHHLNNLKNKLIVDSKQNDLNEQKAQKIFNELRVRLTGIINKLARDISRTISQIREMKNCVATESAIMTTASNKVLRNRRLKNSASHTCVDFAKAFVDATRNRLAEIRTIQEVMTICSKRFGELPHALVTYLEQVRGKFKAYVNSTAFQQYQAYVEKHIADNVYGRGLAHGRRFVPRQNEAKRLAAKNLNRLTGRAPPKILKMKVKPIYLS